MGKMFAVHLMAFYFSKLKEDQIKKVRRAHEAERCPAPSSWTKLIPLKKKIRGSYESLLEKTLGAYEQ